MYSKQHCAIYRSIGLSLALVRANICAAPFRIVRSDLSTELHLSHRSGPKFVEMNWFCGVLLASLWLAFAECSADSFLATMVSPMARVGAPISGEHIPQYFFAAAEMAEQSKQGLQNQLRNFLESLQKNLTTSSVLGGNDFGNDPATGQLDPNGEQQLVSSGQWLERMSKLQELSTYFHVASDAAGAFARDSEQFYESAKLSSYALLLRLRQVPRAQSNQVKLLLTNYFTEMEFFHIMFSEIVDEALEYTQCILRAIQKTFIRYADAQRAVLQDWNFKADIMCSNRYMDFLHHHSAQIFQCAAGHELSVAYDVYAMTLVNAKYIMRQLEFRIQRLFNCLLFGNYQIRCRFLHNIEQDFERLFNKLEELETYYDIKTKRGRVTALRLRRRRRQVSDHSTRTAGTSTDLDKCMPDDFPLLQMSNSLRSCFYFIKTENPN